MYEKKPLTFDVKEAIAKKNTHLTFLMRKKFFQAACVERKTLVFNYSLSAYVC